MRTLMSSLCLGLLTSAVLAGGCGQDDSIDLSEVPEAVDDTKADVWVPGSAYTWVRPSSTHIACVRAPCPNAILFDVNVQNSQLSYAYDWRALKLSATDQANLEAGASDLLLYGKYATAKMRGESVQIYQVTRANPRVSQQSKDNTDSDRFYMVKSANPSCSQPPCGYTGLLMNQPQRAQWTDLDLSRLGLPQNARQTLVGELQQGSAYISIQDPGAMPAVVTQAFRSYKASPLPNN